MGDIGGLQQFIELFCLALVANLNRNRMSAILSNRLYHLSGHTDAAKIYHDVIGRKWSGLLVQDTKQNGEYELDIPVFLGWRALFNKLLCFDCLPLCC
jgi:hypothetical protein